MPTSAYTHDVFLSHSSKDKPIVRPLAERLKRDGLRVWLDEWEIKVADSIPAKIEEGLEHSRVLVLCMSANGIGSDWVQLESQTFRFNDPLNKERRFIPLRLDDAPVKGSLRPFLYVDWRGADADAPKREQEYAKLLDACRPAERTAPPTEAPEQLVIAIPMLGHTARVWSVAWSPDGRRALSGAADKTVRLWDVESGRCLRVLEGHTAGVYGVAWSPDGRRALSGAVDNTVRLWDVESGRSLRVLEGHTASVWSVAWSPDGGRALSAANDNTVRLWEAESGRCLRVLAGHGAPVCSVAWSPDGRRALSGATDNTVRLWKIESGRCLRVLEGHTATAWCVAWSPDGRRALSGAFDHTVRLWEVASGRCLRVLAGHTGFVRGVAWSPDGRHALSGADDSTIRLWDVEAGRGLSVLKGHTGGVNSVAWSPDGRHALCGADDNTLRLWNVESGRCLRVLEGHTGSVHTVAWSPDGRRALSGAYDKTIRLWEVESGCYLRVLKGHSNWIRGVAWSPDGRRVLSVARDQTVRLWEVESGRCLRVLEGHSGPVNSVAWSPDGGCALTGAEDKTVRLWEVESGRCLCVLEGHRGSVFCAAWSPDGRRALSGARDQTVRFWEVASGRCLRVLEGHTDPVWSAAWSPDGGRALTGAEDKTIRLWDAESGRCLRVLEGHTAGVLSVAWSPDGGRALTGAEDKTVRLWEVESGRCLRVLEDHTASVQSVGWSPDGRRAFSAALNGVMRIWALQPAATEATGEPGAAAVPEQLQYTNAKVLLAGDSGVGKTGLSNYLALGIKVEDNKPLPSTDGAWATQWPLQHDVHKPGAEREIWLWDFAGQVDYRLVQQLFMDDTAAAVLVFNPQNENPFEGLGRWDRDLQKATRKPYAKLLVGGRVDRGGLVVSAVSLAQFMAERGFRPPLHLTSAKTEEGCEQLRRAIVDAIDWQSIPETTSPALYRRMKQEILALRDTGLVLIRLAELKQRMELTLGSENFELAELETVVGLLAGPGMIQWLDFGGFILLRPEVLSRYAAAVVRKVRQHPQELGCIREDELLAGNLDYQDFERLESKEDEAVVLRALLETFVSRAWCLRQPCDGTAMLTYPSYFRRERKEQPTHPSVLVTYRFDGPADDIYATLVVRLHHTVAFESTDLWRAAADFKTQTGANLGFTLARETEGTSRLEVYFEPEVDTDARVIFLRYVHEHLRQHAQNVQRLRVYFCGNKSCDAYGQRFSDQAKIDKALALGGKGRVFCSDCGKPIILRDAIEQKFETPIVQEKVRVMQVASDAVIVNESRELILFGHAQAIATEAGQIYRAFPTSAHGLDAEIEFTDDQGRASGKRLFLQLKSGDSYVAGRQEGEEAFRITNPRWADSWREQGLTVMLVLRTPQGEIRWMDMSAYLTARDGRGGLPLKRLFFRGERFDVMSVRRWRDKLLGKTPATPPPPLA